jgi:hypothetical protein
MLLPKFFELRTSRSQNAHPAQSRDFAAPSDDDPRPSEPGGRPSPSCSSRAASLADGRSRECRWTRAVLCVGVRHPEAARATPGVTPTPPRLRLHPIRTPQTRATGPHVEVQQPASRARCFVHLCPSAAARQANMEHRRSSPTGAKCPRRPIRVSHCPRPGGKGAGIPSDPIGLVCPAEAVTGVPRTLGARGARFPGPHPSVHPVSMSATMLERPTSFRQPLMPSDSQNDEPERSATPTRTASAPTDLHTHDHSLGPHIRPAH